MKRTVSIPFMTAALLMMLVFMTVPHHHHDEMMCWAVSYCETDHAFNDEHTGHDAKESHSHNEPHAGEINEISMPPENDGLTAFHQSHFLTVITTFENHNCILDIDSDTPYTGCQKDKHRDEQDGFMSSHSLRAPPAHPVS
ncbi:MAG: hypothetical protein LBT35_02490 [Tannerella sp.]|nr:hypothetical protein [Tannerella sp.]